MKLHSFTLMAGLLASISGAAIGAEPAEYRYDKDGNVILVINKDGTVQASTYEADGRQIRLRDDAGPPLEIKGNGQTAQ